jgi:hypothetical protein
MYVWKDDLVEALRKTCLLGKAKAYPHSLLVVLFKLQTAMHGTVPSFSQLVVSVRVESGKASVRNWGTQVVDDR